MRGVTLQSRTDVIDLLVAQHEDIRTLFVEVLTRSGKEREATFVDLRRLLAVHEAAEEEVVHPKAKRRIPNGDNIIDDRLAEEHDAKEALAELEAMDVDSAEFGAAISRLRNAVLDHAAHEETEEFAALGEELSVGELERMTRAARLAEAVAPTRPHPGIESQGLNLLVGPFAAMLDRARDAIAGKR